MRANRHCEGQALIESCLIVAAICLILMGLFQVSQLFAAREIMAYAAARGARARAVGFNDFMARKTARVASIPNAGHMTVPARTGGGPLMQREIERARIPLYLLAEHQAWANAVLNYEEWDAVALSCSETPTTLNMTIRQNIPIRFFPRLFRAFFAGDAVNMSQSVALENHYPLYLQ